MYVCVLFLMLRVLYYKKKLETVLCIIETYSAVKCTDIGKSDLFILSMFTFPFSFYYLERKKYTHFFSCVVLMFVF